MKQNSLVGKTFNRLTVIGITGRNKRREIIYLCQCSCGNITTAISYQLKSGGKKSCGCLNRERIKEAQTVHGESGSRLHQLWKGIKSRCYNKNSAAYKNYGGRGIKMCDEWRDNFLTFKEFMIKKGYDYNSPRGEQTIERIDVNGDYSPDNCVIVSQAQQNYNKRNNHYVEYKGERKTVAELANEYKIDVDTLLNRINHFGYTVEEAIEKPVIHKPRKVPEYTINGETHSKRGWAEKFGLTYSQMKSKTRHKTLEQVVEELLKGSN